MIRQILLLIFIFFFCFSSASLFAQTNSNYSDSLKLELYSEKQDTNKINLLIELGNFYQKSNIDSAAFFHSRAAFLSDSVLNYKKGIDNKVYLIISLKKAESIRSIGWDHYMLGDHKSALSNCFLAVSLLDKIESSKIYDDLKDTSFVISFKYKLKLLQTQGCRNVGVIFESQGDKQKALEYYFRALSISKELINNDIQFGLLINIRNIYRLKADSAFLRDGLISKTYKKYEKIVEYDIESLRLAEAMGNSVNQAVALNNIGSVYIKLQKHTKAEDYLLRAYNLVEKLNVLDLKDAVCINLSNYYEQINRPEEALKFYKYHIEIKDSILNDENSKAIIQREIQFNYDKKFAADSVAFAKEKEINLAKLQKESTQRYSLFGGLSIVIIFSILIFNRFKKAQEQKKVIEGQKVVVESKNKQITDSIKYALGIQQAMLVSEETLETFFPQSFIYYSPKDIVSGDFYWFSQINNVSVFAVVDCTGHGVPGGFLTMLGHSLLNEIVNDERILIPSKILNALSQKLYKTFRSKKIEGFSSDGMDLSVCTYDGDTKKLQFAGAKGSLYFVQNGLLSVIKGDIWSIGSYFSVKDNFDFKFKNNIIEVNQPTSIYLTTDGVIDQFSEATKERFGKRRFSELLVSIRNLEAKEQKQRLIRVVSDWKGESKQTDDQLVVGFKI